MLNHEYLVRKSARKMDPGYNKELKLYGSKFYPSRFHCSLEDIEIVHHTRESLVYALALLCSNENNDVNRAIEIIEKVLDMQDKDMSSQTYGIWPWYYEEPLSRMRRPDYNWADFCGKLLAVIAKYFQHFLPEYLRAGIREALLRSCESIIKRDVGPHYTNICIMDCLVTIITGELYCTDSLFKYGLKKFETFYEYTKKLNGFEEYNSPTYQRVSINELSCIYQCVINENARSIAQELLDIAWRTVAQHFHISTKQWGGPHGRCYNTLADDDVLSFIQVGTDGKISFFDEERLSYYPGWYHGRIICPEKYIFYMTESSESLVRDLIEDKEGIRKYATFYKNQNECLGTFDKNIMWGHNRAFIAYINNNGEPSYIHMQFLVNHEGFCSAVLTTAQNKMDSLIGINFALDYGAVYLNFDPTNGKIKVDDMRLRFEIGGNLDGIEAKCIEKLNLDGGELALHSVRIGDRTFYIRNLLTDFDGFIPRWQISRDENKIYVDYIFFNGGMCDLNLASIKNAVILLSFTEADFQKEHRCVIREDTMSVQALYSKGNIQMHISVKRTPDTIHNLFLSNTTRTNYIV